MYLTGNLQSCTPQIWYISKRLLHFRAILLVKVAFLYLLSEMRRAGHPVYKTFSLGARYKHFYEGFIHLQKGLLGSSHTLKVSHDQWIMKECVSSSHWQR